VLVVHGSDDVILPLENASSLAKKIDNSSLIVLDGLGHMFWIQSEKKTAKRILRFLNDQDKSKDKKPTLEASASKLKAKL